MTIQFLSSADPVEFHPRTTVRVTKGDRELALQSDDSDFFRHCAALKQSFDHSGAPTFRCIADLNRYYREIHDLTQDTDRKRREAFERYSAGRADLAFVPEPFISEFLRSRNWGDPRYLPLKTQYFEVLVATLVSSRKTLDAQDCLQKKFPASRKYSERVDNLLGQAFGKGEEPVRSYLRFVDSADINLDEVAAKLLAEAHKTADLFEMLSGRGEIRGDVGLPYLVDVYRRYAEWTRPLLVVLSNAVSLAEGRPLPAPTTGMTKRAELIRQSGYSDIVDCFDPRIRHAASHNAISYDHGRRVVKFTDVDRDGNSLGDFELTYVEVCDKARAFIDGLVPGLLDAFGMRQQTQLLLTIVSGEYLKLLLLIDNEAT